MMKSPVIQDLKLVVWIEAVYGTEITFQYAEITANKTFSRRTGRTDTLKAHNPAAVLQAIAERMKKSTGRTVVITLNDRAQITNITPATEEDYTASLIARKVHSLGKKTGKRTALS